MRNDNSTANAGHDDGFASGFGNPDFVPGPRVVAPAFASVYGNDNSNNNNYYDNYPMAQSDAKPIYSSAY